MFDFIKNYMLAMMIPLRVNTIIWNTLIKSMLVKPRGVTLCCNQCGRTPNEFKAVSWIFAPGSNGAICGQCLGWKEE